MLYGIYPYTLIAYMKAHALHNACSYALQYCVYTHDSTWLIIHANPKEVCLCVQVMYTRAFVELDDVCLEFDLRVIVHQPYLMYTYA